MAIAQSESKRARPRRTFTMDDEVFERLTRLAEDADISRSRLLEQMVGQDHEVYERLTQLATSAELGASLALAMALASSWSASCSWGATRMNYLRIWLSRLGRMKGSSWST